MMEKCPECGSKRVWKDGLRFLSKGKCCSALVVPGLRMSVQLRHKV